MSAQTTITVARKRDGSLDTSKGVGRKVKSLWTAVGSAAKTYLDKQAETFAAELDLGRALTALSQALVGQSLATEDVQSLLIEASGSAYSWRRIEDFMASARTYDSLPEDVRGAFRSTTAVLELAAIRKTPKKGSTDLSREDVARKLIAESDSGRVTYDAVRAYKQDVRESKGTAKTPAQKTADASAAIVAKAKASAAKITKSAAWQDPAFRKGFLLGAHFGVGIVRSTPAKPDKAYAEALAEMFSAATPAPVQDGSGAEDAK